MKIGPEDAERNEQLWEVQRIVTQLKRKIKFARKAIDAAEKRKKEKSAAPKCPITQFEVLDLQLQKVPEEMTVVETHAVVERVPDGAEDTSEVPEVEKDKEVKVEKEASDSETESESKVKDIEKQVDQTDNEIVVKDNIKTDDVKTKLDNSDKSEEETEKIDTKDDAITEKTIDTKTKEAESDKIISKEAVQDVDKTPTDDNKTISEPVSELPQETRKTEIHSDIKTDDAETDTKADDAKGDNAKADDVKADDEKADDEKADDSKTDLKASDSDDVTPTKYSSEDDYEVAVDFTLHDSRNDDPTNVYSDLPVDLSVPKRRSTDSPDHKPHFHIRPRFSQELLTPIKLTKSMDGEIDDGPVNERTEKPEESGEMSEELKQLKELEDTLKLEEEELVAMGDELRKKLESEQSEIERLKQEITEIQYLRQDSDCEDYNSSSSDTSYESDEGEELQDLVTTLIAENEALEKKNSELCQKIHDERMICLGVKVQIRLIQQRQLQKKEFRVMPKDSRRADDLSGGQGSNPTYTTEAVTK